MKIALALDGDIISTHFGHCEKFMICEIVNGELIEKQVVHNPCLSPSDIPEFLKDKDVVQVIAAGIGGGAIDMLKEQEIDSIRVDTQDIQETLDNYLRGNIEDLGSKCDGKFRE